MCRIAGIVDFYNSLSKELLEKSVISMRDSMAAGGPDDSGIFISEDKKVAFGHRRLSIIDLSSSGHQPMSNREQTIWITYNGEIYNFQELKDELISKGYEFKSKTDTEVLIYGYQEWGIDALLKKLRGMFAFAIYDNRQKEDLKIILVRDWLGIRPLYYYYDYKKLIFASEVKGILQSGLIENKKNLESLIYFLQQGSVLAPYTTVRDVYSLGAGSYMVISNGKVYVEKYWDILNCFVNKGTESDENSIIEQTKNCFFEAFKMRLLSDAKLAFFLSGGIDSSALVSMSEMIPNQKLTTVSLVFDQPEYNEREYQQLIAKQYNTDHHEVVITKDDFFNELPKILSSLDQPTVDGINTYFIAKAAKELGIKSVLSGIGGDELFLGYRHFKHAKNLESFLSLFNGLSLYYRKIFLKGFFAISRFLGLRVLKKLEYITYPNNYNVYLLYRGLFSISEVKTILSKSPIKSEFFTSMSQFSNWSIESSRLSLLEFFNYMDFSHFLQEQILKDTDFMGMAHGVEIRVPFLDHRLVETVTQIKPEIKLKGKRNKFLLTKIANKLPDEVLDRKKTGFVLPFAIWLKDERVRNMLFEDGIKNEFLENLWTDFLKDKVHWSRIWAMLVFKRFLNN